MKALLWVMIALSDLEQVHHLQAKTFDHHRLHHDTVTKVALLQMLFHNTQGYTASNIAMRPDLTRFESVCMSMSKIFTVPVARVFSLVMFITMQYYLLHSENGIPSENNLYMTKHQFQLTVNLPSVLARVFCSFVGLPGLVAASYAASIMITFHTERPGCQGSKGSDVLMALAVLLITFLSGFDVTIY